MLTEPSAAARVEEDEIIRELFRYIDKHESFLFDAGAGAGKTYALVECLKHVMKTNAPRLSRNGQEIVCITYTNVAANEITKRLGNSNIVVVSTIHDFLWSFIKRFQVALLQAHREKIRREISLLEEELENSEKCADLGNRIDEIRQLLSENMDEYLNIHYKSRNASEYREKIQASAHFASKMGSCLSNVSKFKKAAKNLIDITRLEECHDLISTGKNKEVRYNTFSNSDRLYRMQISHDTLLEYCRQIFMESDEIKRIFIDKYPYIFIDEYQDTHIDVVTAIEDVLKAAEKTNRNFLVGYFGDKAQRIYCENSESVKRIHALHALKHVEKRHNRRSAKEIIDVANRIRNDAIRQVSIFDDAEGGSCKFYLADSSVSYADVLDAFEDISFCNLDNGPLDIFLLANKKVAEEAGFIQLYDIFYSSQYYKAHFDRLNSELMSKHERNLGKAPRALRNIIGLRRSLESGGEKLTSLLPKRIISTLATKDLREILNCVSGIAASSLAEYMVNLVESIDSCQVEGLGEKVKRDFAKKVGIDSFDCFAFEAFLSDSLCFESKDEDDGDSTVQSLMELEISIYDAWFDFLLENDTTELSFHTFHGTKGDEYDRVLAIAGNRYTDSSRSARSHFDLYFEKYADVSSLDGDELKQFQEAQNLLYVAVTRARKHFSFVYQTDEKLSDISRFNIERLFGEISEM